MIITQHELIMFAGDMGAKGLKGSKGERYQGPPGPAGQPGMQSFCFNHAVKYIT